METVSSCDWYFPFKLTIQYCDYKLYKRQAKDYVMLILLLHVTALLRWPLAAIYICGIWANWTRRNGINWVFNMCYGVYFVYHVTEVPYMYHPWWKLITLLPHKLLLILGGETTWSILSKRWMFYCFILLLNSLHYFYLYLAKQTADTRKEHFTL